MQKGLAGLVRSEEGLEGLEGMEGLEGSNGLDGWDACEASRGLKGPPYKLAPARRRNYQRPPSSVVAERSTNRGLPGREQSRVGSFLNDTTV